MNILLSSAGRRVGILEALRRGLAAEGIGGRVIASDAGTSAPAAHLADGFERVPRCTEPGFLEAVQAIVRREGIGLIVPTIDTELGVFAAARSWFLEMGVTIAISSPETTAIAADKRRTNAWLGAEGLRAVGQRTLEAALDGDRPAGPPWIVKPARGSASAGVQSVGSVEGLEPLRELGEGWIVEERARGAEHTIHVYVDRRGRCLTAVPCKRLEVRAGEVSKGLTVRHEGMIEAARRIAEGLPGARGPLNVQGFLDDEDVFRLTEINARFGGGYPLVDRAGAPFAQWLIAEAAGRTVEPPFDGWEDDLAMLRYDDAAFVSGSRLRERESSVVHALA